MNKKNSIVGSFFHPHIYISRHETVGNGEIRRDTIPTPSVDKDRVKIETCHGELHKASARNRIRLNNRLLKATEKHCPRPAASGE